MSARGEDNVEIAFALTTAAGMGAALGGLVVFLPGMIRWASAKVLAISLAFSAGVMIYVSFVEIFEESFESFEDDGFSPAATEAYGTLSFFAGVMMVYLLSVCAHYLQQKSSTELTLPENISLEQALNESLHRQSSKLRRADSDLKGEADVEEDDMHCMEESIQKKGNDNSLEGIDLADGDEERDEEGSQAVVKTPGTPVAKTMETNLIPEDEREKTVLKKVGLLTALAIALHNFPEGLATFIATLDDPKVGAALAVAIGIHNIPEGICVAVPIYYASGSKWKAFAWAFFSGLTEPLGALIGWLILRGNMTDTAFGIVFALVAGMMVQISFCELLPTAQRYDTVGRYTVPSLIIGMAIMALSLVMFKI